VSGLVEIHKTQESENFLWAGGAKRERISVERLTQGASRAASLCSPHVHMLVRLHSSLWPHAQLTVPPSQAGRYLDKALS
jgi:hypothetical protein